MGSAASAATGRQAGPTVQIFKTEELVATLNPRTIAVV